MNALKTNVGAWSLFQAFNVLDGRGGEAYLASYSRTWEIVVPCSRLQPVNAFHHAEGACDLVRLGHTSRWRSRGAEEVDHPATLIGSAPNSSAMQLPQDSCKWC